MLIPRRPIQHAVTTLSRIVASQILLVTGAARAQESTAAVELPGGGTMEMVWIPPGSYTMGTSYFITEQDTDLCPGLFSGLDRERQWQSVILKRGSSSLRRR